MEGDLILCRMNLNLPKFYMKDVVAKVCKCHEKHFQENKNKVSKIQIHKMKKKKSTFEICCSFIDLNKQNFEKVNSFRDT